MTPTIDTQQMSDIATILDKYPLAGTCALLVMFILGLCGFIFYLHRCNAKAEKEDTKAKQALADGLLQLSSRVGRIIIGLERHNIPVPKDVKDDDETLVLADIIKGKKR